MLSEIFNIDSTVKVVSFKKGEILQRSGDKASKIFYIKSGLLKSYTIDKKGKEHIFMFGSEGWIMSDIESQAFDDVAILNIECLEDSEIKVLDRKTFNIHTIDPDKHEMMFNTLFKRIAVMQRRVISLLSATARERYESFLEIYPDLPNRVPLKMIASYLGVTPEALSTIRGKIARDK